MKYLNEDAFNILATIVTVALFILFILAMLKHLMNYRIKNRIIDKGISGDLADSILRSDLKEEKNQMIKWAFLLGTSGAGFTIIYYSMPLGIHSLAILCFSTAAGFLGYGIFLRNRKESEKK